MISLVATALSPQIAGSSVSANVTLSSFPRSSLRAQAAFRNLQSRASSRSLFRRLCSENNHGDEQADAFSVLPSSIPWDNEDVWSIFAAYFFILHVPLSFGGLSIVASILHEPDLDPLTMVVSLSTLQVIEYAGALTLLYYNAKRKSNLCSFFLGKTSLEERSWVTASAVGIGSLIGMMFLSSIVADMLLGPKDVNNLILKDMLSKSPLSTMPPCFFLYCLITPLLEETVYRGFLLSSLASTKKWWQAIIFSSFIFSIGHFSGENFLQLFLVGCVLGSAYCWTGQLASCFTIHSMYNATILLITFLS
ncbi:uncharacterized protein LOC121990618 [Zingiber officinale]|uniref:CAAX prenyl protease 2/Lysostaphin resistance protein A-like domain-containing protein n=1 Tax=Zingiber officinale TaxID=94328 RepID=A0A8J5KYN6_ZINOF|nr:uncharacterized protein LOC121990618 [Zingiber officinale]KAG6497877.1 hypothetical protein ZIOFF_045783 [Zingiber officinale]